MRLRWTIVGVSLAVLLAGRGAVAQRNLTDIPAPDPELERRALDVAEGFEINLYAADPLLAKPIQMNFDPAGRLWVASSEVYPHIKPGQKATDKIIVLEDADGDGRAEKTTVFADGLLIPTGVEPGDGGAYVGNSTELLHLADTDGDGRADRRRIMLSGFGTEDTHHLVHTLRWGLDGQLYFNQSIYIHSHIETPYGVRRLGGGGIWQFRPETMRLEVFARGWVNAWGHDFDRWGQSFVTDGAGGEGINYAFPGATFVATPRAQRILPGLNPGSPKYCGLEIVSGRHLPDAWQGNLITCDFRAHRVCRFIVSEDAAGYASREQSELIKTTHVAFRPIDVKMGPDGAIYIADWYNPIIQHGEVDFRDERRDHVHGRIWRVTAKGRPLVNRPKLVGAETSELLDALKLPEAWTRTQAKRALKERGAGVLGELASWVGRLKTHDPHFEHDRLEALWIYQALDAPQADLLRAVLGSSEARARAAGVRVLGAWHDRLPDSLELLKRAVSDEHPRVRLEAVRALSLLGTSAAAETALAALERPLDGNLDFAVWLTTRDLEHVWLPQVRAGKFDFGGNRQRLLYALLAAESREAIAPLVGLVEKGEIPSERMNEVVARVARDGGPGDLTLVLGTVLDGKERTAERRAALLSAMVAATTSARTRPAGDLHQLVSLLGSPDLGLAQAAAKAVGAWRIEQARPELTGYAMAAETRPGLRKASIDALAALGGANSRETLCELSRPSHDGPTRTMAVEALAALDMPAAAAAAAELLADAKAKPNPQLVLPALVGRQGGPAALVSALKSKSLPPDVAKLAVRVSRAVAPAENTLVEALRRSGGLAGGPQTLAPAEIKRLVDEVAARGDAARGEAVFRRKELACLKCHAIGGAGGQVGPDLASIGGSAQVDYLIESILEPNKKIKENYHTVVVLTDDGRIQTGIKLRETDRELVLRDAEDRQIAIPLTSIEQQSPGISLMPAGLAENLTRGELVDLVRFMSELGKVGPYSLGKERVVRRWQVLELTPAARERMHWLGPAGAAKDADQLTWTPAYSQVSGTLPLRDVVRVPMGKNRPKHVAFWGIARCQFQATTPGAVKLRLDPPDGLSLWLDGTPLKAAREMPVTLTPGLHTLTVSADPTERQAGLRVELVDVAGSKAQVQVVGGK